MLSKSSDIVWQKYLVNKKTRQVQHGQKSCLIWFTGLSGSGKSTIAGLLELEIVRRFQAKTYLLDGDNIRHGLCGDLGFSDEDRVENIRRVSEVGKLLVDAGLITMAALISPFRKDRERARAMFQGGEFIEVFIDTPLDECERRDPKGLYAKVRAGEIKNFSGIDSPYEKPDTPEIHIKNSIDTIDSSVEKIITYLYERKYF